MAATPRVFLVTGSNKGIGKSIVKLLLQHEEKKIVYITSRSTEQGKKAVDEFVANGLHPKCHQLDITDKKSIESLRDYLVKEHGGLDVLINNAGMSYPNSSTAPFSEQAKVTTNCNFFGTLNVCDLLFPILKTNGRVAHVSTTVSVFTYAKLSDSWKSKFGNPNLTMEELKGYMSEFISDAQEDKVEEHGWPRSAYGMSKIGVSLMTSLQQKMMDKEGNNVIVNACCPGFVATDRVLAGGIPAGANLLTPEEGADTPFYLALLDDKTGIKGCFVRNREVVPYPPS